MKLIELLLQNIMVQRLSESYAEDLCIKAIGFSFSVPMPDGTSVGTTIENITLKNNKYVISTKPSFYTREARRIVLSNFNKAFLYSRGKILSSNSPTMTYVCDGVKMTFKVSNGGKATGSGSTQKSGKSYCNGLATKTISDFGKPINCFVLKKTDIDKVKSNINGFSDFLPDLKATMCAILDDANEPWRNKEDSKTLVHFNEILISFEMLKGNLLNERKITEVYIPSSQNSASYDMYALCTSPSKEVIKISAKHSKGNASSAFNVDYVFDDDDGKKSLLCDFITVFKNTKSTPKFTVALLKYYLKTEDEVSIAKTVKAIASMKRGNNTEETEAVKTIRRYADMIGITLKTDLGTDITKQLCVDLVNKLNKDVYSIRVLNKSIGLLKFFQVRTNINKNGENWKTIFEIIDTSSSNFQNAYFTAEKCIESDIKCSKGNLGYRIGSTVVNIDI